MFSMEYSFLGRSGLRVSNICLGTMTFGHQKFGYGKMNKEESHKILDRFVALGGNFIDTANMYSLGISESIIGEWLVRQKRDDLVVATKVRAPMGAGINDVGLGRKHVMSSCAESLRRLQTDNIDLYQIHWWDDAVPPEEWLETLRDLVNAGRVRHIGVSNLCGWQLQKVVNLCQYEKYPTVISLQQQYNLLCRHSEFEEFQVCKNEGISVLPWSPLKGGMLTGKYTRGVRPDVSAGRIGIVAQDESQAMQIAPAWSQYEGQEHYWRLLEAMGEIAKEQGKTISQVAIRWLLQKDVVSSVIIGATSKEQLEDNVGAASDWCLNKEQMDVMDKLSELDIHYPHAMVRATNADRTNPFYPYPYVKNTRAV